MFHMKSILALEADKPDAPPLYMYVGSHNFSINAWGRVHREDRVNVAGMGAYLRLANIGNLECGVVVKGGDITGMLETTNWQDIVPYVRPSAANVRSAPQSQNVADLSILSEIQGRRAPVQSPSHQENVECL